MCTGSNQTLNALVTEGPFTPGEAFAAAQLTSNFSPNLLRTRE
jgi:hypothetical protein